MKLSVSVDGQSLNQIASFRKQLLDAEKELLATPGKEVPDITRLGKLRAKRIAPIDTGALVNAIVSSVKTSGKGKAQGRIESRTPQNPKHRVPKDYQIEMHQRPREKNYSGDPQYMFTTRDYIRRIATDKAKGVATRLRNKLGQLK